LPKNMVRSARTATTLTKAALPKPAPAKTTMSRRASTAKAAVFTPAAMKAVTGVGAPSYTSGVQRWNGTAAILKASPAPTSPSPTVKSGPDACPMPENSVDPVAPYTSAAP
jgi:hypothetical protein